MTPLTRPMRRLLDLIDTVCILICSATLILCGFSALSGAQHAMTNVLLMVLTLALLVWRVNVMQGRASANRKPLTQRWQAQRRARRASK